MEIIRKLLVLMIFVISVPAFSADHTVEMLSSSNGQMMVFKPAVLQINPGFAGQKFIESTYEKIIEVKEMIDAVNPNIRLEVDGGINLENIGKVAECGANTFVAGSAIFNSDNYKKTISQMREIISKS